MRERFLKLINDMVRTDIRNTPNFLTTKALYENLKNKGLPAGSASKIVACIKVDVNDSFVKDVELFQKVIEGYGTMLFNMKKAFEEVDEDIFWYCIEKQELTLSYGV